MCRGKRALKTWEIDKQLNAQKSEHRAGSDWAEEDIDLMMIFRKRKEIPLNVNATASGAVYR